MLSLPHPTCCATSCLHACNSGPVCPRWALTGHLLLLLEAALPVGKVSAYRGSGSVGLDSSPPRPSGHTPEAALKLDPALVCGRAVGTWCPACRDLKIFLGRETQNKGKALVTLPVKFSGSDRGCCHFRGGELEGQGKQGRLPGGDALLQALETRQWCRLGTRLKGLMLHQSRILEGLEPGRAWSGLRSSSVGGVGLGEARGQSGSER